MLSALVVGCADDEKKLTSKDDAAVSGGMNGPQREDAGAPTRDAEQVVDAAPPEVDPCSCEDPALPVCIEVAQRCVECTDQQRQACPAAKPVCGIDNVCAECNTHSDCHDPAAPVCSGGSCTTCTTDAECGDGYVCDEPSGRCGECTRADLAACKQGDVQHVCDAANLRCTQFAVGSAKACEPCVSDLQCEAGHVCVGTEFNDVEVGYFCLPLRTPDTICPPLYAQIELSAKTIDGKVTDACRSPTTTCPALVGGAGHGTACGVNADGERSDEQQVRGDDSFCGVKDAADAPCLDFGNVALGQGNFRCTVFCPAQAASECPGGAACLNAGSAGSPKYVCGI
jgi:hypothetical protein